MNVTVNGPIVGEHDVTTWLFDISKDPMVRT